jgi:hypothetical protein
VKGLWRLHRFFFSAHCSRAQRNRHQVLQIAGKLADDYIRIRGAAVFNAQTIHSLRTAQVGKKALVTKMNFARMRATFPSTPILSSWYWCFSVTQTIANQSYSKI